MINFRNTLYVVNDRVTLDCKLGRPMLNRAVLQSELADKIIVMDRIGCLGKTFQNVVDLAKVRTNVCMYVCKYATNYMCMYVFFYVYKLLLCNILFNMNVYMFMYVCI